MSQNIGDIFVAMGVDTAGLEDGFSALQKLQEKTAQWAAKSGEFADKVAAAFNRQAEAVTRAALQTTALQSSLAKAGAPTALIQQNADAFNNLANTMSKAKLNSLQFSQAQSNFKTSTALTSQALRQLGQNAQEAGKPVSLFSKAINELETASIIAVGPLSGIGSRLRTFGQLTERAGVQTALTVAGFAAAGVAFYKLSAAAISATREMQSINAVFKTATGSSIAAANELKFVTDISQKLGLEIAGTAKQYGLLIAATKGTNVTAEDTKSIFLGVSDAAAALQLDTEQTRGIFKAFTDVISKGTFQMEEMRGQLGDRLPGALGILATAFGVTIPQLINLAKQSKLSSDEIGKVGDRLQKVFHADAIKNADTLNASFQRLSNSSLLFFNAIGDSLGIADAAKNSLNGIANALDFMRLNLDKLPAIFATVVGGMAAVGGVRLYTQIIKAGGAFLYLQLQVQAATLAFGGLSIVNTVTTWFTTMVAAVSRAWAAFRLLAASLGILEAVAIVATGGIAALGVALGALLLPLTIIAGVIGIAVGAFYLFRKATEDVTKGNDEIIKKNQEYIDSLNGIGNAQKVLTTQTIQETGKQLLATRLAADAQLEKIKELTTAITDSWAITQSLKEFTGIGADTKELDKAVERYKKYKEQITSFKTQLDELNKSLNAPTVKLPGASNMTDKAKEAADDALRTIMQVEGRIKAMQGGPKALFEFDRITENVNKLERMDDALKRAGVDSKKAAELTIQYSKALDQLVPAAAAYDLLRQKLEMVDQVAQNTWNNIEDGIMGVINGTETLGQAFSNVISQMLADITKFYLRSMFLRPSGQGSFLGDIFGSILNVGSSSAPMGGTVPKRAKGGGVSAGKTFMVGEQGPELFSPSTSGTIIPNMMGSGGATTVNINVVNKAGNTKAQVTETSFGNTRNIDVIIDEIVASKIGNTSSRTNKALRNAGQSGGVVTR